MAAGHRLTILDAILWPRMSSSTLVSGILISMCGILWPRFIDPMGSRFLVKNRLRIRLTLKRAGRFCGFGSAPEIFALELKFRRCRSRGDRCRSNLELIIWGGCYMTTRGSAICHAEFIRPGISLFSILGRVKCGATREPSPACGNLRCAAMCT